MSDDGIAPQRPGVGILLPTSDPLEREQLDLPALAREVEAAGFDSLWVGDHLAFHAPILEATVAMAAAAAVTERIALGFGVFIPALRPLAWAAKQLGSLQVISCDRLLLGVGVGGENPAEWAAAGVPVGARGRRTDAMLGPLLRLLDGDPAVDPATGEQVPRLLPVGRRPPLWVGGRADASLRRAARVGDGWLGIWLDAERVARSRERLAALAEEEGRPVPRIAATVFVNGGSRHEAARQEIACFLESQYRLPFAKVERYAAFGEPDDVVGRIEELTQAGVEDLVLVPASRDPREQLPTLSAVCRCLKGGR